MEKIIERLSRINLDRLSTAELRGLAGEVRGLAEAVMELSAAFDMKVAQRNGRAR